MNMKAVLALAAVLATAAQGMSPTVAQIPVQATTPVPPAAQQISPQELDAMLAPIALYPDQLVSQILMASTYPLEVVEADRWLQDPHNAALKGDALTSALAQQPWDPSVKSLVPFPQILHMMDGNLTWMERLGDAFLADQAGVMDSIQRLRQLAQSSGKLASTPQQVVSTDQGAIVIEPANPTVVYVPVYDPWVVYGLWPWPAWPPYYFPGYFGGVVIGGFGFGWFGVPIIGAYWGWNHWNWRGHRIDIDRGRWGPIGGNRPFPGNTWQHDPAHRLGVPYRGPAAGMHFGPAPRPGDRGFRGYPSGPSAPTMRGPGGRPQAPGGFRPTPGAGPQAPGSRQGQGPGPQAPGSRPMQGPGPQAPGFRQGQGPGPQTSGVRQGPAAAPHYPPAFESFGNGPAARGAASRGFESRTSPSFGGGAPRGGGNFGGGGFRGGGGGGGGFHGGGGGGGGGSHGGGGGRR